MKKIFALLIAMILAASTVSTGYAVESPSAPIYSDTDVDTSTDGDKNDSPSSPITGEAMPYFVMGAIAMTLGYATMELRKKSAE